MKPAHRHGKHTPYIPRWTSNFCVTHFAYNTPPKEFDGMPKRLTQ